MTKSSTALARRGGREPYLVESPVLMTGDVVTDARVRPGGRLEGPYVSVELDERGAQIFDAITSDNVGRQARNRARQHRLLRAGHQGADSRRPRADYRHASRYDEAHDLAIVLRSGALPAPVEIEEERTVGPSLGRDSIRQGELSFVVGALVRADLHGACTTAAPACSPTSVCR